MALTLNNFIGFGTGGLQEVTSFVGSPVVQSTVVRTGSYALSIPVGVNYSASLDAFVVGDASNSYIFSSAVYLSSAPSSNNSPVLGALTDGGIDICWYFRINTNRTGHLYDSTGSTHGTTPALSLDEWHRIEVLFDFGDSVAVELWIDGVKEIDVTGVDTDPNTGDSLASLYLATASNGGGTRYFDDIYMMSGASSASDLLGQRVEVLGPFQNRNENDTDQGTTLDQGTWTDTADTPVVEEGTPAGYTGGGDQSGYVRTDEPDSALALGIRGGPFGLITGTSKGAKWIYRLKRGSGSGTVHNKVFGQGSSLSDTTSSIIAVTLGTGYANFFQVDVGSYMPVASDDYFCQGFRKQAGGREIYCAEIWSFLLHLAPDPSTLDLTDTISTRAAPSYHGPFGI